MNISNLTKRALAKSKRRTIRFIRQFDPRERVLPDFLIIGAQKAGTSSLFQYLAQHPQVFASLEKEVHYFDTHFRKPLRWYQSNFPTVSEFDSKCREKRMLCGEASPYYLYHPLVPKRVKEQLPNAKLLVILRDPVERTYSHYKHEVAYKREKLGFKDALAAEPERLEGVEEALISGRAERIHAHPRYSYVDRSRYTEQLQRWFEYFDREQFHIITLENLKRDPAATMKGVFSFLGIDNVNSIEYKVYYAATRSSSVPEEQRLELENVFAEEKIRLQEMLGDDLGWDENQSN